MKHHFFLSPFLPLWGMSGLLAAQEPIRSDFNMFRANDIIVKQQVEYKNPGRQGTGVLWDFRQLKTVDSKYTVVYEQTGDSLLSGTEHHTRYYYGLRNDSLFLTGYENPTTKVVYDSPELLLRFPLKLGDKAEGYYQGRGAYCDKLDIKVYGTSSSTADASGMIILPSGDTLRHVTRVRTTKLVSERNGPLLADTATATPDSTGQPSAFSIDSINYFLQSDTGVLVIDTYRWYAAGYRYPVFEIVSAGNLATGAQSEYFSTAFYFPPDKHAYLKTDRKNTSLQAELLEQDRFQAGDDVKAGAGFTYNYYPNPVQSHLYLEYDLSRDAKVSFGL